MGTKTESIEEKYSYFSHLSFKCDREAVPSYTPYEHQTETWKALEKRKSAPCRGIIALPTGAGKTYTAVHWLARNVLSEPNPRPVLWIAHRAELLQQAAEELFKCRGLCQRESPLEIRCISGIHGKPISTVIAKADVIFVTIQSLSRRDDLVKKFFKKNPDAVVVVDEAHHAAAKSYQDVLRIAAKKKGVDIIGLTATPTRTIEKEIGLLNKVFADNIIYQISLSKLIEQGILSRPICKTIKTHENFDQNFTRKELQHLEKFGDIPPSVLEKIGKSTSRNKFILNQYLGNREEYGKTIIFATNIMHCYSLAETFLEAGIPTDYIASKRHDKKSNQSILAKYKSGEIKVLVSVIMLTEGVDLPTTQTVFLTRPTGSEILMRQMIGRALRGSRAGGSKEAQIVSFSDHWERFPDWLDPFRLLFDGDVGGPDKKDKLPLIPFHIPWELISAISALAPDIRSSELLSHAPVGWYALERGNPDLGYTSAVLVYEHQKEEFDRFIRQSHKGFEVLKGRGGAARRYFEDIPDPIPSNQTLRMLNQYVLEFGKPKYIEFKERDEFDPDLIAEKCKKFLIPDLREKAEEIYHQSMASKLYPTKDVYIGAVFEALAKIMAKEDGNADEISYKKKHRAKRPPYEKWPLRKIMNSVREEMGLTAEPEPKIRWSKRPTKTTWAVYRAHDNTIVVNHFLQTSAIQRRTIEFLVYHELLHCELGIEAGHGKEFRKREREFPGYAEADADLGTLTERIGYPRLIHDSDGSIRL